MGNFDINKSENNGKGLKDWDEKETSELVDRIIFLDKILIRSQQQLAAFSARLEALEKMFYPAHSIKISEVELNKGEVSAVYICSICGAILPLKEVKNE